MLLQDKLQPTSQPSRSVSLTQSEHEGGVASSARAAQSQRIFGSNLCLMRRHGPVAFRIPLSRGRGSTHLTCLASAVGGRLHQLPSYSPLLPAAL